MSNFYEIYFRWLGKIVDIFKASINYKYVKIEYQDCNDFRGRNYIFIDPTANITIDIMTKSLICSEQVFIITLTTTTKVILINGNQVSIKEDNKKEKWFKIIAILALDEQCVIHRIKPPKKLKD